MLLLDQLIFSIAFFFSFFSPRLGDSKAAKLRGFGSSSMDSSPAAGLKRARGLGSAVHAPCCLVDGCRNDLRNCREYHRRHKVCELHSKTPTVTIAGQEQRFCQQCSRFHSLGEFDEEKRSCRKRLDGHNRRRRKPQPEPLSLNSGRYLSTYQGTSFSPFHRPPMFPTVAMTSLAMSGANSESNIMLYNAQSQAILARKSTFAGSPCHSYATGKEISFIHGPNFPEPSLSNLSFIGSNSGPNNDGLRNEKVFSEWFRRDNSVDSNCALSLLSSAPACSTNETGSSKLIVQPNSSVGPRFYDGFGTLNEPLMNSAFGSDRGENTGNLHCQDMFHIRADGSSRSSQIPR